MKTWKENLDFTRVTKISTEITKIFKLRQNYDVTVKRNKLRVS